MRIDICCPTYQAPHPRMKQALDAMTAYAACQCALRAGEQAKALYDAMLRRDKKAVERMGPDNPFHAPADCPKGKHDIWFVPSASSCIIHWSRNELLKMRRAEADYVLFIDSDIVVEPDTLERLLGHGKDVVAGACTRRIDPPQPNFRRWVEAKQNYGVIEYWSGHGRLLEVDAVGTGLMLISRKVIEHVAIAYHRDVYLETGNGWWFEFWRNVHNVEWGEDITFCAKARRLGYQLFVDTSVCPGHLGDYNFGIADHIDLSRAEGKWPDEQPPMPALPEVQIQDMDALFKPAEVGA